jgi:hypothetical protein
MLIFSSEIQFSSLALGFKQPLLACDEHSDCSMLTATHGHNHGSQAESFSHEQLQKLKVLLILCSVCLFVTQKLLVITQVCTNIACLYTAFRCSILMRINAPLTSLQNLNHFMLTLQFPQGHFILFNYLLLFILNVQNCFVGTVNNYNKTVTATGKPLNTLSMVNSQIRAMYLALGFCCWRS